MITDFSPLFRNAIGFDRLARLIDTAQAAGAANGSSFPPYNIEKTGDDSYVLTLAVAGFGPDDIEVLVQDNTLRVSGRASGQPAAGGELLHRGIATRAFDRRFALADHIQVENAELVHGLLRIGVKRVVPEALKPRRISIGGASQAIANDGAAVETTKAA